MVNLVLTLLLFVNSVVQVTALTAQAPVVEITGVEKRYTNFDDIKPVVINRSSRKIYSYNRGWGLRLLRYNETSREWEKGIFGFVCATDTIQPAVSESRRPLKPGAEILLEVNWRRLKGWEGKLEHFKTENGQLRVLNGKYKLLFEYAYEPWEFPTPHPKKSFAIESIVFELAI